MLLGRAIQGKRDVVLLGDIGCLLDPHPTYYVAVDIKAQDGVSVGTHVVDRGSELDASGLASPTGVYLGLDHDWCA